MSKNLAGGAVGLVLGLAIAARASAAEPPKARTGFQMAIRTGYSVPMGSAFAGISTFRDTPLSEVASGQVPLLLDIGGKVHPNVFVGGYLGLAFGAPGRLEAECDELNRTCIGTSLRFGVEGQYQILPSGPMNPWVGYGFGVESTDAGDADIGLTLTGWEFARFMGGVDFRLSRVIGLGPFVDLTMGSYARIAVRNPGLQSWSDDIPETRLHEWFTFGARVVFFP